MLGTVYENEAESHLHVFRCFKKIQNETWGTSGAQKDAKTEEEVNYTLTRRWFVRFFMWRFWKEEDLHEDCNMKSYRWMHSAMLVKHFVAHQNMVTSHRPFSPDLVQAEFYSVL
jgi:hypothetical protein